MTIPKFLIVSVVLSYGSGALEKSEKSDPNEKVYAVVIDAGSTGSRVVGYEFKKNGPQFILLKEQFNKTRPGLSSFADDPSKGAENITNLLNQMKDFVPDQEKGKTILYLRATAGLRLLGDAKSKELLEAIQKEFDKTDYLVRNDSAAMLSGTDEGIMAWFTVNYLKHTLDKDKKTFAAIEMGGASAQVTYEPNKSLIEKLRPDIHKTPDGLRDVFSKSYLGLGLQAARHAIIEKDAKSKIKANSVVCSRCLDKTIGKDITFNNTKYRVHGRARKGSVAGINYKKCKDYVQKVVYEKVQPMPLGLSEEEPVALSAFYYRGKAGKLIVEEGGNTTVGKIKLKAKEVCASPTKEEPYLCMDLIYMYTLLKHGYGLQKRNRVEMIFNIDDHELSWALGFAYSKLIAPPEQQDKPGTKGRQPRGGSGGYGLYNPK